jgi:BolA protein
MKRQLQIQTKLMQKFQPLHLDVINESHMHSVPPHSETHFRVVVVSQQFVGLTRVERQRLVNSALADELKTGVHALGQQTLTPEEWKVQQNKAPLQSPECHSKKPQVGS